MNDIEGFRKLRRLMDIHEMERFTLKLDDQKPLKVVVRGASMDEIEEDLRNQKLPFQRITRLKKNRNEDCDMVMITTDRTPEGKKIFGLTYIQGLRVSVEPKKKSSKIIQCFRCQKFGHGQS